MAWTTEKVPFRNDNTVAMLVYNIRHRFELTASCIVQTKRFGLILAHFALLHSYLITEKLNGNKTPIELCDKVRRTHERRVTYINKTPNAAPQSAT